VCAAPLSAQASELKLFPAGTFDAPRGAMQGAGPWRMDAAIAARVIARHAQRGTATVIDYEHQTLLSAQNGQPAPAAGWFTRLAWREGDGLYATDVTWTERARAMLQADEYRYLSPVFPYAEDGAVLDVLGAALTNDPGLDSLPEISLQAAARAALRGSPPQHGTEESPVNEALLKLLGLSAGASEEDVQKAVAALKAKADQADEKDGEIAALKQKAETAAAATPDPEKYVSVKVVEDLRGEIAALRKTQVDGEVDGLVSGALGEGRLLPAQEQWARELGGKDVAALRKYLETAQPIAALAGSQTKGKTPAGGGDKKLTDEQVAMCRRMGISEDEFLKAGE
jgi:phage I-like protein